jgi:hypothetical protein
MLRIVDNIYTPRGPLLDYGWFVTDLIIVFGFSSLN